MNDAMNHAEDALTRFIKSSTRLARPAEVEKKRVDLMVRELLTIRPYSAPSQIKIRSAFAYRYRRKENRGGASVQCSAYMQRRRSGLRRVKTVFHFTQGSNVAESFDTFTQLCTARITIILKLPNTYPHLSHSRRFRSPRNADTTMSVVLGNSALSFKSKTGQQKEGPHFIEYS